MKTFIRHWLRNFGFEVARYRPAVSPHARRRQVLNSQRISVVLDVGANVGQYGKELRDMGYRGRIVSFEPLTAAFERLAHKASRDSKWQVLNYALGSVEGKTIINVAGNSYSSSLLEMLEQHKRIAPQSAYVGTQDVIVRRLDSVFDEICSSEDNVYLKIDTQGFEKQVLEGSEQCLHKVSVVQLEMSLTPLYQDSSLMIELYTFLCDKGFRLTSIEPGFTDNTTGQMLQADGVFQRMPK